MDDVGTGSQDRGERPAAAGWRQVGKHHAGYAGRAERRGGYACIIAGAELLAG